MVGAVRSGTGAALDFTIVVRSLTLVLVALAVLAGPVAASPVDAAAAEVARLERQRAKLVEQRAALAARYDAQAAAIGEVRRQRASWGRDRKLRALRAAAKTTEKALTRADEELREVDSWLDRARTKLIAAIDRELAATPPPSAERRAQLTSLRARTRREVAPEPRKIVLPSARIDPLADADELEEQVDVIEQTERDLEREETLLARRERRYRRMARLQRERARADEVDLFDDDRPRRTVGRTGTGARGGGDLNEADDGAGGFDADPAPPPAGAGEDPGSGGGVSEPASDPVVVLADVVDGDTLDAMRRAERSNDPAAKAEAAARARKQVRAKREQLAAARARIQTRIKQLRGN